MVKALREKLNGHLNKFILTLFIGFIGWIAIEVVGHGKQISTNTEKCTHNEAAIVENRTTLKDVGDDIKELIGIAKSNRALLLQRDSGE